VSQVRRALIGAVLLDLAVSPLFIWSAFSGPLSAEIGVPSSALSLAYAVGLGAFTAGVLVGGWLADRVAAQVLALVVAAVVVAGLVLTGIAQSPGTVVAGYGVLLGGASGVGYATAVRVAASVAGRRGSALALVVSAYAAGAVVLAPVVDVLWDRVGRTATFGVLAGLLGALLLIASALLAGARRPPDPPRAPGARVSIRPYSIPLIRWWVVFALGSAPALIAFGHAAGLARSSSLAVVAVVLLNSGNFGGRLLAGPVADRTGHGPALHVAAFALVVATLVLALVGHPVATLAALLVIGAQYGAISVLVPMIVADAVPTAVFGTAYGLVFSGWGVVGLTGPIAAGALAEATSYTTVAVALVGVAALFWGAVVWASTSTHQR